VNKSKLPSKEQFWKYVRVQSGGRYNMICQWTLAAAAAGLTREQYRAVVDNYEALAEKYPDVVKE